MHASVDRLIERLADPRLPGADFMETFLLTYRAFSTSDVVIRGLIEAYWDVMGGYPTPKKTNSPERKKLAGKCLPRRQNCRKINVEECIFDNMASHIEC